ncbi:MAG: hypothetical protein MEQ07_11410 [Aquimonas sp.]|nr:hypothetical protein [Aquimonas sp.]
MLVHQAQQAEQTGSDWINSDFRVNGSSTTSLADMHSTGTGATAKGQIQPQVLVFNQGFDFLIPYRNIFDFDQLAATGSFSDITRNGIRVRSVVSGIGVPWVHLSGSPISGRVARQPDASERWTVDLPPGSHAFEFRMWESSIPGTAPDQCFNFNSCTDTLYRLRAYSGATLLQRVDFSPYNNRLNTVALWSRQPITRIELFGEVNNIDDEFLGDLRAGANPPPVGLAHHVSREHSNFGLHAALRAGRALISDSAGFEYWRKGGDGAWTYENRLDLSGTIDRLALSPEHAVVASGGQLRIYRIQGDAPWLWPLTTISYPGVARSLDIDGDWIALGLANEVRLHRRDSQSWRFEGTLTPDPPIPNASEFGPGLDLHGERLAVSAGGGMFHVYRRNAAGSFVEEFRQTQQLSVNSSLALSDSTLVLQSLEGALRLYEEYSPGFWRETGLVSAQSPAPIGLSLGRAVRADGDRLIQLEDFQLNDSPNFRQVVSIWARKADGQLERTAVFVDPHLPFPASANLGSNGRAFALDGDDLLFGQPGSDLCLGTGFSFLGDNGSQNYRSVCGQRSGAVYFARASKLGVVFESGFEP